MERAKEGKVIVKVGSSLLYTGETGGVLLVLFFLMAIVRKKEIWKLSINIAKMTKTHNINFIVK